MKRVGVDQYFVGAAEASVTTSVTVVGGIEIVTVFGPS